jgi:peptidoglycan/xylan/chitin deacetylase (PgdA/CDA1 family)
MKSSLIAVALVTFLLLGCAGCGTQRGTTAASSQKSKCLNELNAIPEVAALRKSRKNARAENNPKLFEGLELALTINGMITSQVNPEINPDDLCYAQDTRENFDKLVKALAANQMPPTVDFIEGDTFDAGLEAEWLRGGNLLGNFSYDRRKAKNNTAKEFIDNVARNDQLLAQLWKNSPPDRKYFRFPHLKAIRNGPDRDAVKAYLKQSGYVEVPVTIDAQDALFAQMYCGAQAKGDGDCANLIKANFFSLLLDTTIKARAIATEVAGRGVKHILVIRANQLTCDTLAEMLGWFKGLGARFISLDEALSDPIYAPASGESPANRILQGTHEAQVAGERK